MNLNTISTKWHASITGLFFITATVTAIIGLVLYKPVIDAADPIAAAATHGTRIGWGAFFEAILSLANCGTALMMLPVLSLVSGRLGPAYVVFRSLEVVAILVGAVSMLALAGIASRTAGGASESMLIGHALIAIHDWTFVLGPHFLLGVNTLVYSSVFFRSGLVPRPLALLGITGASLILVVGAIELLGVITPYSLTTMALAMPIAVYEMVLAGRLIVKGFDEPSALRGR
ncbi:MAG: DUF4386 domain-containing protein [Flavobacteriales bacterium]|nr:DUF4386 domain-containing protein [Flavobacteriales bacterium]MCB9164130.1 DUF4386 domain-containing protein [Flavobacteriales bacterium]MCB9178177.1 DUF4386 domain-containing protein [Flavobacteriales bacterium]